MLELLSKEAVLNRERIIIADERRLEHCLVAIFTYYYLLFLVVFTLTKEMCRRALEKWWWWWWCWQNDIQNEKTDVSVKVQRVPPRQKKNERTCYLGFFLNFWWSLEKVCVLSRLLEFNRVSLHCGRKGFVVSFKKCCVVIRITRIKQHRRSIHTHRHT